MKQLATPILYICFLMLLSPWQQASAEVYKRVDEQGKVIFTDQPSDDAEMVEIKELNTSQPVKARASNADGQDQDEEAEYGVTITSPEDEKLFPNRLAPFTVSTKVTPTLKKDHRLRLKIDGKTHSISVGSFTVSQLSQGEHTLVVEIIDADDLAIAQSPAIAIFAKNPG